MARADRGGEAGPFGSQRDRCGDAVGLSLSQIAGGGLAVTLDPGASEEHDLVVSNHTANLRLTIKLIPHILGIVPFFLLLGHWKSWEPEECESSGM